MTDKKPSDYSLASCKTFTFRACQNNPILLPSYKIRQRKTRTLSIIEISKYQKFHISNKELSKRKKQTLLPKPKLEDHVYAMLLTKLLLFCFPSIANQSFSTLYYFININIFGGNNYCAKHRVSR